MLGATVTPQAHDEGSLRRNAARILRERGESLPADGVDTRRLLHELQVHQIELEMQQEELERSRHALEVSLKGFKRLYEDAPIPYLTLDHLGRIERMNQCALHMLGGEQAARVGTPLQLLIAPGGREAFLEFLEALSRDAEGAHCEFELIPHSHARMFVQIAGTRAIAEGLYNVALIDLSERRAMELALKAERRLFARAEAICHLGSWRLALEGNVMTCSDEMLRMCGSPPGTEHLDAFRQLLTRAHPDDRDRMLAVLDRMLRDGRVDPVEFRVRAPDGTTRWLMLEGDIEHDIRHMPVALGGFVLDVTDRVEAERTRIESAEKLADTDPLTGLLNRRGFDVLAAQAVLQAGRTGLGMALLYIDVDSLKGINDRFGHAAGDEALRDVAQALRGASREADIVARLGGDEFVVLAIGSELEAEERLLTQMDVAVDRMNEHRECAVHVTCGASVRDCEHLSDGLTALVSEADSAMYRRKAARGLDPRPQA